MDCITCKIPMSEKGINEVFSKKIGKDIHNYECAKCHVVGLEVKK